MSLERPGFGGPPEHLPCDGRDLLGCGVVQRWVGGHCAHMASDFLETLTLSLQGFAAKTEMDFDNKNKK